MKQTFRFGSLRLAILALMTGLLLHACHGQRAKSNQLQVVINAGNFATRILKEGPAPAVHGRGGVNPYFSLQWAGFYSARFGWEIGLGISLPNPVLRYAEGFQYDSLNRSSFGQTQGIGDMLIVKAPVRWVVFWPAASQGLYGGAYAKLGASLLFYSYDEYAYQNGYWQGTGNTSDFAQRILFYKPTGRMNLCIESAAGITLNVGRAESLRIGIGYQHGIAPMLTGHSSTLGRSARSEPMELQWRHEFEVRGRSLFADIAWCWTFGKSP